MERFEKLSGETVSSGAPKYICEDGYGERSTTRGETPRNRNMDGSGETGFPLSGLKKFYTRG